MTATTGPGRPGFLLTLNITYVLPPLLLVYFIYGIIIRLYQTFYGPLSRFPGPKRNAFSVLPFALTSWRGKDNADIPQLHAKYGRVVRVTPDLLSFVGTAEAWRDIHGFRKQGAPEVKKDPRFYATAADRAPSLIISDYETHARQRKIVSHAFSDRALKEQEPMLQMWAGKLTEKLREQAQAGDKTDMLKTLHCVTFDIMGELTFAEPLYMLENGEYSPWVRTIFGGVKYATGIRALSMLHPYLRWTIRQLLFRIPALRRKLEDHWRYTTDRVDRRLAKTPDRPDLWSRILEKSENFTNLSRREHYSNASLFMIAGTETTATLLSGAMYYLLRNPQYLKRLQDEIRSVFGSVNDLKLEPLAQLTYLEAVLKEALRIYPPVPIGLPRLAPPGGLQVDDHFVPEGTRIMIHQQSTYRYPENFKNPNEFHPERWLGDPEYAGDKFDVVEPFSVGPRNCLGKNLAWHEMRLLLSTVLLHFDVELCDESASWANQKVYTLWEKPSLMCRLTEVAK